jgi:nucleotide-binding universal stress UspA family protein
MATTYVAGYDGSAASRAAVQLAVRIAGAAGADVVAAYVYRDATSTYGDAETVVQGLDVPCTRREVVRSDSPARGLHELAEATGAELIAVGTTRDGRFGRLAPGSMGMHLLQGAPCPVLIAPANATERPLRTIGVAYDDREEARAALHVAEKLARQLDAQIVVLGVTQSLPIPVGGAPAHDVEGAFEAMLARTAAESRPGTEHRVMSGAPGRALAEASADVDVLVTGSRTYGPVGGVLLGSVSRYVVDHAACPVLVVPRPAHAR